MLAFALLALAADPDIESIRTLRAASNAAIAAHDVERVKSFLSPTVRVMAGAAPPTNGALEESQAFAQDFGDASFITYVRTPAEIEIGPDPGQASETGRWVGIWRTGGEEMRACGKYLAFWVKAGDAWKIEREAYMPSACAAK